MIICPNEDCLLDIDVTPEGADGSWGEEDGQVTYTKCPYCDAELRITAHITYSGEVVPPPTTLSTEEEEEKA